MKQILKLVILVAISIGLLSGCASNSGQSKTTTQSNVTSETAQTEQKSEEATTDTSAEKTETANMNQFSTQTLDGKEFTQTDFSNYDLTMVNLWTTWCPYCINEMPELQKVYESLPANVNMISICCDADEEADLAKQILTENGCKFQTLISNDSLESSLLLYIEGFPTTVFVDKEGNVVGEMQVGAPAQEETKIADAYLKLIQDRLNQLSTTDSEGNS